MDRRTALQTLLAAIPFNQAELARQTHRPVQLTREPGVLTVPLDQWKTIVVEYDGKSIEIPVALIFETLAKP